MTDEPTATDEETAPRPWLVELKGKAACGDRPRDKPLGRWLGDFLDQNTPSGLLRTELDLLDACANGGVCEPAVKQPEPGSALEPDSEAARRIAVEPNRIRGGFLRFLALGGDGFAPVHESGIELHNALIDSKLDLRGGKCVGRLVLANCVVLGDVCIEDASLGVVYLRGSLIAGLTGNRAKISGSVFLDHGFVSNGDVLLFSAQIDGSLICDSGKINGALTCFCTKIGGNFTCNATRISGAFTCGSAMIGGNLSCNDIDMVGGFTCSGAKIGSYLSGEKARFADGVWAQGTVIAGDAKFSSITAKRTVSLVGAQIGGSLRCSGATFRVDRDAAGDPAKVMLDFSRAHVEGDVYLDSPDEKTPFISEGAIQFVSARIGGNVYFWGSSVSGVGTEQDDRQAVNGQNVKVEGSVYFSGGFVANGPVSFSGAEIAKDLDFSDATFRNQAGVAIIADQSKVSGTLKCLTTDPKAGGHSFQSFGAVIFSGAQCGALNCNGGTFSNPDSIALDCSTINIAGSVYLRNIGARSFEARGAVKFHSARIGQHLDCGGGQFHNAKDEALNGEAAKIAGCVFLNGCDPDGLDRKQWANMAFRADGKVTFVGALVGLQFNCQWGRFRNAAPNKSNAAYADTALDLSSMTIGDTLFLGLDEQPAKANDPDSLPATIEGAIDLTAATVRMLVDDGLVGDGKWGLRATVTGEDGRQRQCGLQLDLFTYDRLKGVEGCKASQRLLWLRRQPDECLKQAFLPQPFEQLIKVLRAMGHDGEADEIALWKRTYARRAEPWWPGSGGLRPLWGFLARLGELVFVAGFLGYGYKVSRALLILLTLGSGFGWFYGQAFQQGAIVPADKDIRNDSRAAACVNWSPTACPVMADKAIPLFNPWLYSADVMIPVIGFGQKAAWTPTHTKDIALLGQHTGPTSFVYGMQLTETVLGWVGGILLLSFISGLIAKE